MVFVGIMTLGIATLIMWWTAWRQFPRLIDSEGITLRNGRRVFWTDLTGKQRITVVTRTGQRIAGGLDLYFGKTKVKIAPESFAQGYAVLDALSKILGEDVCIG